MLMTFFSLPAPCQSLPVPASLFSLHNNALSSTTTHTHTRTHTPTEKSSVIDFFWSSNLLFSLLLYSPFTSPSLSSLVSLPSLLPVLVARLVSFFPSFPPFGWLPFSSFSMGQDWRTQDARLRP
ncbi:MAG: hypothetical protein BYD32DRAFT_257475 [Podila humilis]|nr:MAG: hypothetical protein BYD32DRAFT_257475 [Podila humilis]